MKGGEHGPPSLPGVTGLDFPMYYMIIKFLFVIFDSEDNLESFSKQEEIVHRHVVLQLVNHDNCNQMPSISRLEVHR